MSDENTDERLVELQEAFAAFDSEGDGSGTITAASLTQVLRSLGMNPSDEEVRDMIDEVDVSGTRTVSFQAFVTMMSAPDKDEAAMDLDAPIEMTVQVIKLVYNVFDRTGKGYITVADIKQALGQFNARIPEEQLFQLIYMVDPQSQNKGLSYAAFQRMLEKGKIKQVGKADD